MTGAQSRLLKVGDRVQWDKSLTDRGTISEVDWRGVTIKWDDGRTNSIYHNDMAQVELVLSNFGVSTRLLPVPNDPERWRA